jgi:hypothetical protein
MQSDEGIAHAAVAALIEGDQAEHLSYYEELHRRLDTRSANSTLSDAIIERMLDCASCNRKQINPLYNRLCKVIGREAANAKMVAAYVRAASLEPDAIKRQKLYKSLCRYVSTIKSTLAFQEQRVEIIIPSRVRMSLLPTNRARHVACH